jgi:hypothetical protein
MQAEMGLAAQTLTGGQVARMDARRRYRRSIERTHNYAESKKHKSEAAARPQECSR